MHAILPMAIHTLNLTPSPSREQGKQKQQKRMKQQVLSFMPRTKAKDLSPQQEKNAAIDEAFKPKHFKDQLEEINKNINLFTFVLQVYIFL